MVIQIKKGRTIFWGACAIMAAAAAIFWGSEARFHKRTEGQATMNYVTFQTDNPALDFTFEYPGTGWNPVESRGRRETYDVVFLGGEVDERTRFRTIIHITVKPLPEGKTAAALLKAYLERASVFRKFKASSQTGLDVGGVKAQGALFEYEDYPLHQINPQAIPLKGRRIFFMRGGRSYEISFVTLVSRYEKYASVLDHLIKTFQFKK
ncbi:MAG: hypothetical protein KTQ49_02460 [Candidatus Omnitrophica bacterium]|nr:hypothetical protein [Candidatus Omnitrophota bacterium]